MSAFSRIGSYSSPRSQSPTCTGEVNAAASLVSSPNQTHHSFRYEIPGVTTPYLVQCCCTDLDTIKTALDKCPFFTTVYRTERTMQILRYTDEAWVPDNFHCNLMCDMDSIIVRRAYTPQPRYPVRHLRAPNDVFVVLIRVCRGSKGAHILIVRRSKWSPTRLLVVVDPRKTIRESLKDDARFSSHVLEGRYTQLESIKTLIPLDQLGQALQSDEEYHVHLKLPRRNRKKSQLPLCSCSRSSPHDAADVHAAVFLVRPPNQTHHSFGYEIPGVTTPYRVQCCCTDVDTIETALDKCPFYPTVYRGAVRNMLVLRDPDQVWVPGNFPCILMGDKDSVFLKHTSTPQPKYPLRHIRAPNEVFSVRVCVGEGTEGVHILNVRRTDLIPTRLLVVVDPRKTIRESLKDDGRFSSQALEGRYTHLKSTNPNTWIPVDQLGQPLRSYHKYDICIKLPKLLRKKSKLHYLLKGVAN